MSEFRSTCEKKKKDKNLLCDESLDIDSRFVEKDKPEEIESRNIKRADPQIPSKYNDSSYRNEVAPEDKDEAPPRSTMKGGKVLVKKSASNTMKKLKKKAAEEEQRALYRERKGRSILMEPNVEENLRKRTKSRKRKRDFVMENVAHKEGKSKRHMRKEVAVCEIEKIETPMKKKARRNDNIPTSVSKETHSPNCGKNSPRTQRNDGKQKLSKNEVVRIEAETEVIRLLNDMLTAAEDDEKAYLSDDIALHKIKMLEKVRFMSVKAEPYASILLKQGFLRCIALWLAPKKNGIWSSIQVRRGLLEILTHIGTPGDWCKHLENAGELGKIVHMLSIKENDNTNKRLAHRLMQRWVPIVMKVENDFKAYFSGKSKEEQGEKAENLNSFLAEKQTAHEEQETVRDILESRKQKGRQKVKVKAQVPREKVEAYGCVPDDENVGKVKRKKGRTTSHSKILKTLGGMKKGNTKACGAKKPSVNGK